MGWDIYATPSRSKNSAPGGAELTNGAPRSSEEVVAALGLRPHQEGGYFRETYRSPVLVPTPVGPRSLVTSILYLLTSESPSRFHRLRFDEVWFYHAGLPTELFLLAPEQMPPEVGRGSYERLRLGPGSPQALVPGGRWVAARVAPAESGAVNGWSLVGCVVSPGFEYEDFELGVREKLESLFPAAAELIAVLT